MAQFSPPDPSPSVLVNLACDASERQLVTLAGYGLNDEEIAATLGYSPRAVPKLLRALSDRLGAGDRYELALYGLSTLSKTHQNERNERAWTGEIETV
jgi:DNA-binding NarL/FixJ family response regulator